MEINDNHWKSIKIVENNAISAASRAVERVVGTPQGDRKGSHTTHTIFAVPGTLGDDGIRMLGSPAIFHSPHKHPGKKSTIFVNKK